MAGKGVHGREGCAWQGGVCMARGMYGRDACRAGEMATAAYGMHPTGMHSCCHFVTESNFIFMQFLGKIWSNNRYASSLGNPGNPLMRKILYSGTNNVTLPRTMSVGLLSFV